MMFAVSLLYRRGVWAAFSLTFWAAFWAAFRATLWTTFGETFGAAVGRVASELAGWLRAVRLPSALVVVLFGLRRELRNIAGCAGFEECMAAYIGLIRHVASAAKESHDSD
jgi:hypothetical protein